MGFLCAERGMVINMKIIFMGTPEFAVPALNALIEAGNEIPLVFTQPDKPSGRGNKIQFPPVKQCALENNIEVFQPLSLRKSKNEEDSKKSLELIKQINPDVIIVAAYGQILPEEILALPRFGCVNIHASLLPRWRGASPIQICIINGDKESGVTIMQMEQGLDTGDMLIAEKCRIDGNMTASELHNKLKDIGAGLIVKFCGNPEAYIKNKTAQDNSLATYAPLITKEMKKINWSKSALEIFNFIRGLSGEAFTFLNNKRLKIFSSEIINNSEEYNQEPGTIYNGQLNGFDIICGDGKLLRLFEIQLEGKSRMKADEFLRGFKINAGDCLEK